jgi:hypothetical protein
MKTLFRRWMILIMMMAISSWKIVSKKPKPKRKPNRKRAALLLPWKSRVKLRS